MFTSVKLILDCKTVRILRIQVRASSQNKKSGTRLKTESETEETEARVLRARKTLTPRFADFFTDFEKKPTVLQSKLILQGTIRILLQRCSNIVAL